MCLSSCALYIWTALITDFGASLPSPVPCFLLADIRVISCVLCIEDTPCLHTSDESRCLGCYVMLTAVSNGNLRRGGGAKQTDPDLALSLTMFLVSSVCLFDQTCVPNHGSPDRLRSRRRVGRIHATASPMRTASSFSVCQQSFS